MPTPSPTPFAVSTSPKHSPSARSIPTYRRVDYYQGDVVRTTESRRRTPVLLRTRLDRNDSPVGSSARGTPAPSSSMNFESHPQLCSPVSTFPAHHKHHHQHIDHVTPILSSKRKAQVVVQQGNISVSFHLRRPVAPRRLDKTIQTPPPTPELGRLATPELDDLKQRPFCNCCTEKDAIKYCSWCGGDLSSCKE